MFSSQYSLLRLRVVADADPGALVGVLQRFQNLNVLPRRVVAEVGIAGSIHIEVDIGDLSPEMLTLIAAKLRQSPCVENAYWYPA